MKIGRGGIATTARVAIAVIVVVAGVLAAVLLKPKEGGEEGGEVTEKPPLWSYRSAYMIGSVAISSDGSYIAAGSLSMGTRYIPTMSSELYLFSRTSSTPLWSYDTGHWINSVAISSDGNYIAAGNRDGKVYLFSRTSSTPHQ